jgi:hypothetical protein
MDRPNDILPKIIYPVVEELRRTLPDPSRFEAAPGTALLGDTAALDSAGVVSFLVGIEERIESTTGRTIRLVSERAMSRTSSPFRTLATLADYVHELLGERA